MLSILIPCYNFNVRKLVKEIYKQANSINIQYEIICIEDGSKKTFFNSKINELNNVNYIVNSKNIGRS
ncbi:MAG: glycosyl transferase, partial [Flavobacteriales bacterium TMED113]